MQIFIPDRLTLRGIKTTPNAGFEQGKDMERDLVKKFFILISCKARKFLCILETI
jgi:hypothetical protein